MEEGKLSGGNGMLKSKKDQKRRWVWLTQVQCEEGDYLPDGG